MRAVIRKSFERDVTKFIRKEKSRSAARRLEQTIDELTSSIESTSPSQSIFQSSNVKKLSKGADCYRVRVGDYRIGLRVVGDAVEFVRLLHRRDFYSDFP